MEINITKLVEANNWQLYSASIAEIGEGAAYITWTRALADGMDFIGVTDPDQLAEVKDYFRGFGAWTDEDIDSWTVQQTNALLLQFAAGDLREQEVNEEYGGILYQGDDGEFYYYVGM